VDVGEIEDSGEREVEWPGDQPVPESLERGAPHYLTLGGLLGGSGTLVLLATIAEPDPRGYGTHEQLGLSPCRLKQWTDVPCPGCGVTTATTLALQGRPVDSFLVQPFGLLTAIGLPLLTLWAVLGHLRGADVYRTIETRKGRWVKVLLALLGMAWIYKIVAG